MAAPAGINMHERYERNIGALTEEEQELLGTKSAAIIGCGGLGAYVAEFLARIGLQSLTVVDGDVYAPSNLNRQLNSLESNLGKSKSSETRKRLHKIRAGLSVKAVEAFLNDENAGEILKGHDVIIDALDNVKTRLLVEKTADRLGIPLIHGAVREWSVQVCTVYPGDFTLSMLYLAGKEFERPSVLSFSPGLCASLEASEAVKVLLNKGNILRKKLLCADLRYNTFEIIDL